MQPTHVNRRAGFTLLEMLIAISIFGVMSAVAYRALDATLTTRGQVSEEYRRWRDVARAIAWMERDLAAIVARPIRDASDRLVAPLTGVEGSLQPEQSAIAFSRGGDLGESSYAPSRVGYRVRAGVLERLSWTGLDQAPSSTPTITALLSGVTALGLRYRGFGEEWRPSWPVTPAAVSSGHAMPHTERSGAVDTTLPAVVGITIELANGTRVTKLVPLHGGARR